MEANCDKITQECNKNISCPSNYHQIFFILKYRSAEKYFTHLLIYDTIFSVDCVWNNWGAWGACDKFCDTGTKTRLRSKDIVAQFGGLECETNSTHTNSNNETCNTDPCPRMSYTKQKHSLLGCKIDLSVIIK